jgi:hypothetical protein
LYASAVFDIVNPQRCDLFSALHPRSADFSDILSTLAGGNCRKGLETAFFSVVVFLPPPVKNCHVVQRLPTFVHLILETLDGLYSLPGERSRSGGGLPAWRAACPATGL